MVTLGFCVRRLKGWVNVGVFVHTAMPAACGCNRVRMCVFSWAYPEYVHCTFRREWGNYLYAWWNASVHFLIQFPYYLYVARHCSCGGLHGSMCVLRSGWRQSMSMSRCGHHSQRATNPLIPQEEHYCAIWEAIWLVLDDSRIFSMPKDDHLSSDMITTWPTRQQIRRGTIFMTTQSLYLINCTNLQPNKHHF